MLEVTIGGIFITGLSYFVCARITMAQKVELLLFLYFSKGSFSSYSDLLTM